MTVPAGDRAKRNDNSPDHDGAGDDTPGMIATAAVTAHTYSAIIARTFSASMSLPSPLLTTSPRDSTTYCCVSARAKS